MKKISFIILLLFLAHCSTQRLYRPLEKGRFDMHFNLGGPLFKLSGMPIFMPFAYLGAGYGLTERWSAGADVPLSLLAFNNLALDLHTTFFFNEKTAVKAELLGVWDIEQKTARLYPMTTGWYIFQPSQSIFIMPGLNILFQDTEPALLASPFVVLVKTFGQWDISFEFDYLVPYLNKNDYNLDYLSFGYGGFGINFGIGRRL